MKKTLGVLLFTFMSGSIYAQSATVMLSQRASQYRELCIMIPECVEKERQKLKREKAYKEAIEIARATPRKKSAQIKEYNQFEERMQTVNVMRSQ